MLCNCFSIWKICDWENRFPNSPKLCKLSSLWAYWKDMYLRSFSFCWLILLGKLHSFFRLPAWSHDILKSKFQISISFEVILIMNQKFIIVFKCQFCLYMQFIKTLCDYVKQNSRYLEFNFRLKFFLSLWSWARPDSLSLVTFSIYVILCTYFQLFSKMSFASFIDNKYFEMAYRYLHVYRKGNIIVKFRNLILPRG